MGNRIYFKIAGWVDLDMLHNFAFKLNLYLLFFFKYKTKSIKIKKNDGKRAITPRWVFRFTSKLQGR